MDSAFENSLKEESNNNIEQTPLINFVESDLSFVELTLAQILSSSEDLCMQIDAMLSSIPVHPYERLKSQYLDSNTEFLHLTSIELPESFCLSSAELAFEQTMEKYNEQFELQVSALTSENIDNLYNAFSVASGDQFVIDDKRVANHLQFVQMCNSIPIQLIDRDPVGVAQRIVSQYLKMY